MSDNVLEKQKTVIPVRKKSDGTYTEEINTFDETLKANKYVEAPSNVGMRVSYDASLRPQYVGYAAKGIAEGTDGWTIQKFDYDGTTTRVISRTIAYGNWTGKTGLIYE